MKKKYFILACLFILFNNTALISQVAFYDAFRLKPYFKNDSTHTDSLGAMRILGIYAKSDSAEKIISTFSKNPFISIQSDSQGNKSNGNSNTNGKEPIRFEKVNFTSLGGIDVTNIADGMAKFMVERFKAELTASFFGKFKNEMLKPEYEDLQILFPQTCALLQKIDNEIYNYNIYLQNMREAFEKDLSNMLINFQGVINSEKHNEIFKTNPQMKNYFLSALYLMDQIFNSVHPGEILANFPISYVDTTSKGNYAAAIKTMQIFSQSLRSQNSNQYWISRDSLQLLLNDPIACKLYLGLIYQNIDDKIVFRFNNNDSITLKKLIDTIYKQDDSFLKFKMYLTSFIEKANTVDNNIQIIIKAKNKNMEVGYNEYYKFYMSWVNLFEQVLKIEKLPYLEFKFDSKVKTYYFICKTTGEVYLDVNKKNYASALYNLVLLYDTLKPLTTLNDSIQKLRHSISKCGLCKKSADSNSISCKDKKRIKETIFVLSKYKDLRKNILKYGSFMSAVAKAENSDDVAAAIEAVALPVGSSSIKTYSAWNISINSYLGGFKAKEKFEEGTYNDFNTGGVIAPVGLTISKGFPKCKKGIGAVTFFGSIVDIGAVTSYRLQNDSVQKIPTITLDKIIAPGGFLVFSRLFNTPLALGMGYQLNPALRKVTDKVIEVYKPINSFKIFLAVDIPIFNLYMKTK